MINEVSPRPSSTQRVIMAAADHGIEITLSDYPEHGARTAEDAAAAVGCSVAQIVKSMIFDAEGTLVVALTSGANQVDGTRLAELAGVESCGRADVEKVRVHTGFAIGGVPPFGHDHSSPTWIDPLLLTFDQVWAAGGTPRHVFPIAPDDLVRLSGAVVADFTR